mmetsp:Transcript_35394/g.60124  ORF Transcript_35394/g.60124 Transcript_35394/m.60124 type:complete len:84 (+) Transcript_35394:227-478(+)
MLTWHKDTRHKPSIPNVHSSIYLFNLFKTRAREPSNGKSLRFFGITLPLNFCLAPFNRTHIVLSSWSNALFDYIDYVSYFYIL